jgi:hypothetical protein
MPQLLNRILLATLTLGLWSSAPGAGAFTAGNSAAVEPSTSGLRVETIAPGIMLLWTPRHEAKVVVAEFATFLALIEAPFDDRTVREILAELRVRFPSKPLRYVFHTHPHDHSIHAVDPLLAAGAQIVTSSANLPELEKLTGDVSALRSRVILVDDQFELADAINRLRVWLLKQGTGEKQWAVPTPEYMVFEFPASGVLVSGCLYNKPKTYHEVVSSRKKAILRFIETNAPGVTTLIPTNTSSGDGFEDVCTLQMLRDSIEQGIKPEEVSKRFGEMTPEQMRAQADAIAAEFKALTPRAFDLMVCASQLNKDKHAEQSLILLDIAISIFPDDPWPRYQAGVRAWGLGLKDQAESRWAEALARGKDDAEREDLRESAQEVRSGT